MACYGSRDDGTRCVLRVHDHDTSVGAEAEPLEMGTYGGDTTLMARRELRAEPGWRQGAAGYARAGPGESHSDPVCLQLGELGNAFYRCPGGR